MWPFHESLRRFFGSKQQQLLHGASEADTPHAGLLGAHREALIRNFLSALLPRRFSVGSGIVYGFAHRSREADVVIWDSANYPSIEMSSYAHFFVESVRLVLEAKSRYSATEFEDMLGKCQAVRDIVPMRAPNLADTIAMLQFDVAALKSGEGHEGMLLAPHHTATAGFFFVGGDTFSLKALAAKAVAAIDDRWPDILVFLSAGVVVAKHYDEDDDGVTGRGRLALWRTGGDTLMVFAAGLMRLISERSVQVEDPSFLAAHVGIDRLIGEPSEEIRFPVTRPIAGRVRLWAGR